jgi:hypothetical protein
VNKESDTYQLGTLSGEILPQWANGFRLKPYYGKFPVGEASGEVSAANAK